VQYYQTDVLCDLLVRLRLETQQLTAPAQLALTDTTKQSASEKLPKGDRLRQRNPDRGTDSKDSARSHLPLLRFQYPFNPDGID